MVIKSTNEQVPVTNIYMCTDFMELNRMFVL